MKIDRLIGIITVLLQNDSMTAPMLAQKFEVSRRTISRDIDTLCRAGIPIATQPGGGGGISIMEGYKIEKSLLTSDELASLIAGLRSIDSVSDNSNIERIITKLGPGNKAVISLREPIMIDLSAHYKDSLSKKIGQFKQAILERRLVRFEYYADKGKSHRMIEPYFIAFKWSAWYVFGYCTEREDFRLFKLNRLWELCVCPEYYTEREIPADKMDLDGWQTDENPVTILFDESARYLLMESYGPSCYSELENGKLLFKGAYTKRDWLIGWILSFGGRAEVLAPLELRQEIKNIGEAIMKKNS